MIDLCLICFCGIGKVEGDMIGLGVDVDVDVESVGDWMEKMGMKKEFVLIVNFDAFTLRFSLHF